MDLLARVLVAALTGMFYACLGLIFGKKKKNAQQIETPLEKEEETEEKRISCNEERCVVDETSPTETEVIIKMPYFTSKTLETQEKKAEDTAPQSKSMKAPSLAPLPRITPRGNTVSEEQPKSTNENNGITMSSSNHRKSGISKNHNGEMTNVEVGSTLRTKRLDLPSTSQEYTKKEIKDNKQGMSQHVFEDEGFAGRDRKNNRKPKGKKGVLLALLAVVICIAVAIGLYVPRYKAIVKVEEAIAQIGAVSLQSEKQISSAEAVYDALPEKDRKKVGNYNSLHEARQAYEEIKREHEELQDLLKRTKIAIDKIPFPVDLNEMAQVENARKLLDEAFKRGLGKELTEYKKTLENMEILYEYDYAQSLIENATNLYSQAQYHDAIKRCDEIINKYDSHDYYAQMCAADCYAALANEEIKDNNLENAMELLNTADKKYLHSEQWNAVNDTLKKKLSSLRPSNGKKLKSTLKWGYCEFTVRAGEEDACVKLEAIDDPGKYVLMYVHAHDSATVQAGDGKYIVKYTTGEHWFGEQEMFGKNASFSKADDIISFETTRSGNRLYYSSVTITIYKVANGNLTTTPINSGQF